MSDDPIIHYGAIASGNHVKRSAVTRDHVSRRLDVICFEMKAAGLMDVFSYLPIRGIYDYSDSHKSKEWEIYAAGIRQGVIGYSSRASDVSGYPYT